MPHYYIQGIGYHPVSKKNLPDFFNIMKVPLLDLYIYRIEDDVWVQKNYISGKIRVIIRTKEVMDPIKMEKECEEFDMKRITKIFDNVVAIQQKQKELSDMFNFTM